MGKRDGQDSEKPRFAVRPLTEMLRDLAAFEAADWMRYVFSREPLNGKFNDEQRSRWMKEALSCGEEYAEACRNRHGTGDAEAIAKELGMSVEYPAMPESADRVLFAEFRKPGTIRIYMDAVRKADDLMQDPDVRQALTESLDVSRLLLAHELFHAVEEQEKERIYTRTEKVLLWSFGPFHNDSQVIALSEIAAMGFARSLTALPYFPWVMDVFLVYGYSPSEASGLYEEIMELAGKAPCAPEG